MGRLEDIEEIRQLTHKYFLGWDVGDIDAATTDVFTADGINDQTQIGSFVLRGHEEMRAHFNETHPMMDAIFHIVGNHIIEFDNDDHAHGTNVQDGVAVMPDGTQAGGKHYFKDNYVRTENGWRFSKRVAFGLITYSG